MALAGMRILALLAGATLSAPMPAYAETAQSVGAAPFTVAAADPFSALVGKAPGAARRSGAVQRFTVAADGRMFLVEGKVGGARLKYLCTDGDPRLDCSLDPNAFAEEIFLATGARGPRGDVIFKDENGDVLLRIMSYGGATVFWPGKTNGEAASKTHGDDSALNLPPASRQDAARRAELAARTLGGLMGESIEFNIGTFRPASASETETSADAAVLADAVVRAAAGMAEVARDQTGARVLRERIVQVKFTAGGAPKLSLDGKSLIVTYNPSADVAGRPSSRAVREFLENSL